MSDIEQALLAVHAGKRALQMARTMRDGSIDRLGLADDIVTALALQLREAEARAAKLIGDGAPLGNGRVTISVDDRRHIPRPRILYHRSTALQVAS